VSTGARYQLTQQNLLLRLELEEPVLTHTTPSLDALKTVMFRSFDGTSRSKRHQLVVLADVEQLRIENQTVNDGVAHSKNPIKCAYHLDLDLEHIVDAR